MIIKINKKSCDVNVIYVIKTASTYLQLKKSEVQCQLSGYHKAFFYIIDG